MDIREALESGFKASAEGTAKPPEATKPPETVKTEEPVKLPEPTNTVETTKPPETTKSPETTKPPETVKTPGHKAPGSWKPAVREKFASLDPEVQEEIIRREADVSRGLGQATSARQFQEEFSKVVAPYEAMIRSEGAEPLAAVQNLFQTAAAFRVGSAHQKAQLTANLIKQFGVDIAMLDSMLAGQPVNPEEDKVSRLLDQRLAPINKFFSEISSVREQQIQETKKNTSAELESFAEGAEFFEDVRLDMADILELAARRDRKMTLKEAYDEACALHPDVSKIVKSRAIVNSNAATTTERANAASSVSGAPTVSGGKADPSDLRGTLMRAWEGAK